MGLGSSAAAARLESHQAEVGRASSKPDRGTSMWTKQELILQSQDPNSDTAHGRLLEFAVCSVRDHRSSTHAAEILDSGAIIALA